jgi:hypothetical protein
MTKFLPAVFLAVAMSAPWVYANEEHHKPVAGTSQAAEPLSEGEVRKVDKDAQKITVRHGPLVSGQGRGDARQGEDGGQGEVPGREGGRRLHDYADRRSGIGFR